MAFLLLEDPACCFPFCAKGFSWNIHDFAKNVLAINSILVIQTKYVGLPSKSIPPFNVRRRLWDSNGFESREQEGMMDLENQNGWGIDTTRRGLFSYVYFSKTAPISKKGIAEKMQSFFLSYRVSSFFHSSFGMVPKKPKKRIGDECVSPEFPMLRFCEGWFRDVDGIFGTKLAMGWTDLPEGFEKRRHQLRIDHPGRGNR